MGAGGSVVGKDGSLEVSEAELVKQLDAAWKAKGGAQQAEIKKLLKAANAYVAKEARAASVGAVPWPPSQKDMDAQWKLCDVNNNNMTSLAELDKMVVESYPKFDNKPALMRAYHACDRNGNGFITKAEFKNFFGYLDYFCKLWAKFSLMDDDGDRRISFEEMKRHSQEIFGRKLSDDAAAVMFNSMDRNGGGKVLFYEFCATMATLDKVSKLSERQASDKLWRTTSERQANERQASDKLSGSAWLTLAWLARRLSLIANRVVIVCHCVLLCLCRR
jgi:Ca2+-binding EF-hand superfamily protein